MKEIESVVDFEIKIGTISTNQCSIKKAVVGLAGQLSSVADILAGQKSHRLQIRLLDITRLLVVSVSNCDCTYPRISKIKIVMRVKQALMECQDCLILAKILGLFDTSPQLAELSKLQRSVENACKY